MSKTILSQQELGKIQEMNNEITKAKLAIGDLEMQKQNILKSIETLRTEFAKHEMELIETYGFRGRESKSGRAFTNAACKEYPNLLSRFLIVSPIIGEFLPIFNGEGKRL